MLPYTASMLDNDLNLFLDRVATRSHRYFEFFSNLYPTGLRFCELQQYSRWSGSEGECFLVDTAKGSVNRTLCSDLLSAWFILQLTAGNDVFSVISQSTASYYFKLYYPRTSVYSGTHHYTTHLFRFNIAKQMHLDGHTDEEIQTFLGESDIRNAQGYIYANLTYI